MGRKRSGADRAIPGDPLATPMAVVPRSVIPPRVSVLQAMCAAAVPDETMGGRQNVEAMFYEGNAGGGVAEDPPARSLLKTGHLSRSTTKSPRGGGTKKLSISSPVTKPRRNPEMELSPSPRTTTLSSPEAGRKDSGSRQSRRRLGRSSNSVSVLGAMTEVARGSPGPAGWTNPNRA